MIKFTIRGLPARTNNSKASWRARYAEALKWKRLVGDESFKLRSRNPKMLERLPYKKAILTLTRHSSVSPDYDGLVSSFKHVIDGLIESGIIENDKMENVGVPTYRWQKAGRGVGYVTVEVEEA